MSEVRVSTFRNTTFVIDKKNFFDNLGEGGAKLEPPEDKFSVTMGPATAGLQENASARLRIININVTKNTPLEDYLRSRKNKDIKIQSLIMTSDLLEGYNGITIHNLVLNDGFVQAVNFAGLSMDNAKESTTVDIKIMFLQSNF